MPVSFAVLQRLGQKKTWDRVIKAVTRKMPRSVAIQPSYVNQGMSDVPEELLPKIPEPTISGLRSYIRMAFRSQPGPTELSTYNELASTDEQYHSYLQRSWSPNAVFHRYSSALLGRTSSWRHIESGIWMQSPAGWPRGARSRLRVFTGIYGSGSR